MDAATGPPTRYAGAPAAILLLVALALAGAVTLVGIAPGAPTTGADGEEEPVLGAGAQVIGWHYRQGGGATGLGYDVREPFLAALRTLGGPDVAGYPISAPFLAGDGCLYQLFQILPLQACPDRPAEPANTFQLLEAQGADEALLALGIGPGEREDSVGAAAAVERRLNWLEDE